MAKIEKLDVLLKPLTPRDLQKGLVPTYKDLIVESVGRKKPKDTKQSIAYWKLADKILEAKESIELSALEFSVVCEGVEENPSGYFPFYHGQVSDYLESIK